MIGLIEGTTETDETGIIRAGTWRDLKRSSRAFLHRLELKTQISAQVEPVQLFTETYALQIIMSWKCAEPKCRGLLLK